jgi:hypothetical protein
MKLEDQDIVKLILRNQRLLLLVGFATALIRDPSGCKADDVYAEKHAWFMKAIENVVYLDKPLPKMP